MTSANYKKSAFPVGYHDFHKDPGFNFQLNRWYSMGYIAFEDLKEAGQKINSLEEWKIAIGKHSCNYMSAKGYRWITG